MKNMIILFLLISMMFILATNQNDSRNITQQNHLDKYFTEYTNRYFFSHDNEATDLKRKEVSKSILSQPILKNMGVL